MSTVSKIAITLAAMSLWLGFSATTAEAGSLNVSPTKLEVFSPQQAAALTLRNMGERPITGQVRVFAWRQEDGEDILEPTEAVVVSPPMIDVHPGADYTIRVVRAASTPVAGEEAYRLVIDEVPDAVARRNGVIAVAIRYVIPLFFDSPEAEQARLAWSLSHVKGKTFLMARNDGDRRAQLRDVSFGGKPIARGLAGYVLGHSESSWELRGKTSADHSVKAVTENGPISGAAD
ncbi:MAG: fimbrial biogenesis chaperone [Methylocystis sp.]|uniref:fimbrial biogenesis chaperone n=1 Tax=Methylocystis sp. TaxID=1911079 RepID=UPI003DA2BA28